MTKDQIDAVLERVHSWPKARQEDVSTPEQECIGGPEQ